jgi:preprotein translocase subunit SecG
MTEFKNTLAPSNKRQAFWISFLLSFILCFCLLFLVSPFTGLSRNFGAGNDGYIQLARSLVAGYGYVFEKDGPPVFHRPPLYPIFLVPVALFPEYLQRYVLVVVQSILVGFIGMMIFKIADELYNRTVAAVAIWLFLINPWVHWNAKNPMTPVLQALLYLIFVYVVAIELLDILGLLQNKQRSGLLFRGLVIGVVGAALTLTHAAMLAVVFVFILILFVAALFRNTRHLLTALIAVIVAVGFIAPWTYRNWAVFGRFIPVAGGGGLAYFNGNVHWDFIEQQPQRPGENYIDASLRIIGIEGTEQTHTHWKGFIDIKDEELANRKMAEHIRNHPALFVNKVILNAIEYYFPVLTKPFLAVKTLTPEQWALSIFHLLYWFTAVLGTVYCWRKGLLLLAGIFLYAVWYFPFAMFIGHSLYTFGTIPLLCIISAAGIVSFFGKEKQLMAC